MQDQMILFPFFPPVAIFLIYNNDSFNPKVKRIDFFTRQAKSFGSTMIEGLESAAKRFGLQTMILPMTERGSFEYAQKALKDPPLFTCSIMPINYIHDDSHILQYLDIPHFYFNTDLALYAENYASQPNCLVSLPCEIEQRLLKKRFPSKNFPCLLQAVDPQFLNLQKESALYDLSFVGTCFDPEATKQEWHKAFSPLFVQALEQIAEEVLIKPDLSLSEKLLSLSNFNIAPQSYMQIGHSIEVYCRGKARIKLLLELSDFKIDVFGNGPWEKYLGHKKNIKVHPGVNFWDFISICSKSKIVLNSAPCLKAGLHERILYALCAESLIATDHNCLLRNHFLPEEGVITYSLSNLSALKEILSFFLSNQKKSHEISIHGKQKIKEHHLWDHRFSKIYQSMQ